MLFCWFCRWYNLFCVIKHSLGLGICLWDHIHWFAAGMVTNNFLIFSFLYVVFTISINVKKLWEYIFIVTEWVKISNFTTAELIYISIWWFWWMILLKENWSTGGSRSLFTAHQGCCKIWRRNLYFQRIRNNYTGKGELIILVVFRFCGSSVLIEKGCRCARCCWCFLSSLGEYKIFKRWFEEPFLDFLLIGSQFFFHFVVDVSVFRAVPEFLGDISGGESRYRHVGIDSAGV